MCLFKYWARKWDLITSGHSRQKLIPGVYFNLCASLKAGLNLYRSIFPACYQYVYYWLYLPWVSCEQVWGLCYQSPASPGWSSPQLDRTGSSAGSLSRLARASGTRSCSGPWSPDAQTRVFIEWTPPTNNDGSCFFQEIDRLTRLASM